MSELRSDAQGGALCHWRGQVGGDLGELIEGSLQVFDDLGRENSGVREVVGIAEAVVAEPEDIEVVRADW